MSKNIRVIRIYYQVYFDSTLDKGTIEWIGDLDLTVWFQARANLHYSPSCLKNNSDCKSGQKWHKRIILLLKYTKVRHKSTLAVPKYMLPILVTSEIWQQLSGSGAGVRRNAAELG